MKSMHRLLLVAAVAVAALALSASTAFGESSAVEVEDAIVGGHCGAVSLTPSGHEAEGGCELHAVNVGTIDLINHSSPTVESVIHQCNNELEAYIDEQGEGWITHQVVSPGTAGCGTSLWRPCWESDPHIGGTGDEPVPWRVHIEETGGPSDEEEHAVMEWCTVFVVSLDPHIECPLEKEFEVDLIRQDPSGYTAEISESLADHFNPCGLGTEFTGHYEFEHDDEQEDYTELDILHLR